MSTEHDVSVMVPRRVSTVVLTGAGFSAVADGVAGKLDGAPPCILNDVGFVFKKAMAAVRGKQHKEVFVAGDTARLRT